MSKRIDGPEKNNLRSRAFSLHSGIEHLNNFPKPTLESQSFLNQVNPSEYIIQPKVCGERCVIYAQINDHTSILTHYGLYGIRYSLLRIKDDEFKTLPSGVYDSLYLENHGTGEESLLFIFDVMAIGSLGILNKPLEDRLNHLPKQESNHIKVMPELSKLLKEKCGGDLVKLFNSLKGENIAPNVEGIVLKKRDSIYPPKIGSQTDYRTPFWSMVLFETRSSELPE